MVLATPSPATLVLREPAWAEASMIGGWSVSASETLKWCSSDEHPVDSARILSWWEGPDVQAYVGVDPVGTVLAYGELWLDHDEDEVELARVIVAPEARGLGVGRRLVVGLTYQARVTGLSSVILRVTPGNPAAIRCYRASGFRKVDAARSAEWNKGQPATYTWMELMG